MRKLLERDGKTRGRGEKARGLEAENREGRVWKSGKGQRPGKVQGGIGAVTEREEGMDDRGKWKGGVEKWKGTVTSKIGV